MKKRLKILLPWIVLAVIFYFLFRQIPPKDVLAVASEANLGLFALYAALYFLAILLFDCFALQWAISRFVAPVSLNETIFMRGASYLLMLINYNLAQGGMAFYLKRTRHAPVFKTLGTVFFVSLVDLSIMVVLGLIAALTTDVRYHGTSLKPLIAQFAAFFFAGLAIWVFFWSHSERPFVLKMRRAKPIDWFFNRQLFSVFRAARLMDYAKIFLWRLPMVVIVVGSFYLCLKSFHSHIPVRDILLYGPLILLVGTLPITPAGMGTGQVLSIEFFSANLTSPLIHSNGFTPAQIILSASLAWMFANLLLKMTFGLYCLRKKNADLFQEI